MFQPGDIIVYGNTGVCKVVELSSPNLPGVDQKKRLLSSFSSFSGRKDLLPCGQYKGIYETGDQP